MAEKEEYTVRIGPLLREVINIQKEKVKEATYDCVDTSDYSCGEIIAKKVKSVL